MEFEIIYEDENVLVVDKPAGIVVFSKGGSVRLFHSSEKAVIDILTEKFPELKNVGQAPRYGAVHRLDKDTSGVLLVAKNNKTLIFLQKCFKNRQAEKKYICLVEGAIKQDFGEIKTLIGRSPMDMRKQKAYSPNEPAPQSAREAVTEYKVLERFKNYTLLEVKIKTGRRHQIRCHFAYFQHPIVGDKLYRFKNSKVPEGLKRQFLHAKYLKIKLPSGEIREFISDLPPELEDVLKNLKIEKLKN